MADLPTTAFFRLRERLFDGDGRPIPFRLRDKRNTQDDPLDEFLAVDILADLEDASCIQAPGPLITPDFVLCRRTSDIERADDIEQIVGIEVKKIERTERGPMLIFANPLGATDFDHAATLIHADATLAESVNDLSLTFTMKRSISGNPARTFYCYRHADDAGDAIRELVDPFPTPTRDTRTRPRGRFTLPFTL